MLHHVLSGICIKFCFIKGEIISGQSPPGGSVMISKNKLCDKIRQLYPEIGECGIDLTVDYDRHQNAWVVALKKGNHELKHFLDDHDANASMQGKQCVALGLEIVQLVKNITGTQL